MYPVLENIINFVRYREDYRPFIMCEYSHAMGNSNGSLADYWKAIESHHGLQGGFIWEWRDHGFEAYTKEGVKYWKYGGDFGDEPSDFDFICDGLLFPDQGLKPAMAECRQVQAPVRLTPVPGKPFTFVLENRYDFSTLDHLSLRFKVFEALTGALDVNVILEGTMDLPLLNPGEKTEITFAKEGEIFVPSYKGAVCFHADFILKKAAPWAEKGHIVAQAERLLKEEREFIPVPSKKTLSGGDLLKFAGLFKPSLFRIPTQNDGLKTFILSRRDKPTAFNSKGKTMFVWLDLDLMHMRVEEGKKEEVNLEGRPAVRVSSVLLAGDKATDEFKRYTKAPGLGTYTMTVTKDMPGEPVIMEVVFDLDQELPELPKVGITAEIPSVYGEISWFGLGPEESYPDRLAGVFLGRHKLGIADFEVPYVVPQENGNRSGVRGFTLLSSDHSKGNITIRADKPVNLGVSRYSQENLWKACHTYELVDLSQGPDGRYFLSVDICQRGLGTATCGPDTREEYRVRPGLFSMRLFAC